MPLSKDELKSFQSYVAGQKILIVDETSTARAYIAKTMITLGAKMSDITLCSSLETAHTALETLKPKIVICDFNLGKFSGLELLQRQRRQFPESKDRLFVLVTGNSSQSAVAQAAEEDVDTYLLKPVTADILTQSIVRAALFKSAPPPYNQAINEARSLIEAGKLNEADTKLREALKLNPKPSLALAYLGQLDAIKKMMPDAEGKYKQGLSFNKIHYKCMVGLFDSLQDQKRHMDAYQVVKRISQYFPANPQRLTQVLKLAIVTKSYEDVETYYQSFKNIDERNDEMVRYVCAALVVVGRYYLQRGFKTRAHELLQGAVATSGASPRMLKEIVLLLLDFRLAAQANDYLARFRPEHQSGIEYAVSALGIMDQLDPPSRTVAAGKAMIDKGLLDPAIYKILIRRSRDAGLKAAVEDLIHHASLKWPELKAEFAAAATAESPEVPTAAVQPPPAKHSGSKPA